MNNMNWDEKLESEAQRQVARLVQELPQHEVNLSWRSNLNDKIRLLEKPKRQLWQAFWMPVSGLAVAGALAMLMVNRPSSIAEPTLEQSIVSAHDQVVAAHAMGALVMAEDSPADRLDTGTQFETEDLRPL